MNNDVVALASVLLFLFRNVSLFSSSLLSLVLVTHGTSFVLFHLCVISRKFSSCPNIIISYYRQILLCMIYVGPVVVVNTSIIFERLVCCCTLLPINFNHHKAMFCCSPLDTFWYLRKHPFYRVINIINLISH